YMKTFKQYIKNYALPEACAAECYLGMECVRFFNAHVDREAEIGARQRHNEDIQNGFTEAGRPILGGVHVHMKRKKLKIAHRYVLFNTAEVQPYIT
ncbi:hypothetical protein MKW94_013061, partial [Papaver nudicaule]|nr:hypothetical protein [Papaver nudicaule]MCL7045740.1 hypothetical protein [Papaver nudicaule]